MAAMYSGKMYILPFFSLWSMVLVNLRGFSLRSGVFFILNTNLLYTKFAVKLRKVIFSILCNILHPSFVNLLTLRFSFLLCHPVRFHTFSRRNLFYDEESP